MTKNGGDKCNKQSLMFIKGFLSNEEQNAMNTNYRG